MAVYNVVACGRWSGLREVVARRELTVGWHSLENNSGNWSLLIVLRT